MKKNILSITIVGFLFLVLSSCSDSDSDNPSGTEDSNESSSSNALSSTTSSESADGIPLDSNGFADIQAVYQSIQPDEKAIFILRHGQRGGHTSKETPLTEDGVEQAKSVGEKLKSTEEFYYLSTDFVRTEETCRNIAIGREQTTFPYDTNNTFTSSAYIKDRDKFKEYTSLNGNNSNMIISQWAYKGDYADAFYNLKETCESIIKDSFKAVQNRITIICSHDEFLVPMIVYLTDGKADVKLYETYKWLYYLAGVAIIVDEKGNRRSYATKGLAKGAL